MVYAHNTSCYCHGGYTKLCVYMFSSHTHMASLTQSSRSHSLLYLKLLSHPPHTHTHFSCSPTPLHMLLTHKHSLSHTHTVSLTHSLTPFSRSTLLSLTHLQVFVRNPLVPDQDCLAVHINTSVSSNHSNSSSEVVHANLGFHVFCHPNTALFSVILCVATFFVAYVMRKLRHSCALGGQVSLEGGREGRRESGGREGKG